MREIAGVNQWDATRDIEKILINAESKLDLHLKQSIGISSSLMLPGNYARCLFDDANKEHVLFLIPNEDCKERLDNS